ncbi:toxic anion resistance protein [Lamprobacter modestohalophilus]|uniref:Toxic anion resistance protein n=1 Tax=Lamprobacter modestohalophilus TaxID=1064514 RepID=A0A9X1B372_9GAMM|nr:toxic anion resistance protein [Lamprobacter modestohalophilus]MBK1617356.1 toxic anion resistance protein [Lamprobacter modestohalophilus]
MSENEQPRQPQGLVEASAQLAPELSVPSRPHQGAETGQGIVALADAPPAERAEIKALLAELDLTDSSAIMHFGAKAQQQLTAVSDQMLEGVRNKDTGAAGQTLSEMVGTLRGFDVEGLDPNAKPGFFKRLFGAGKPIMRFLQEYEAVRDHIDRISIDLERHKTRLLTDVTALDRLYEANLDYFRELEHYIAAGEAKLDELDQQTIPALAAKVEQAEDMVEAQNLRDLRSARDDLERRVHDLRLTRQVAMQALPSIRLVQENDKGLIGKINSTLVNTVPLWRQQLAQAVTIYRSGRAAETVKAATDLTNDLLKANAANLKTANAEARRQIERGVFDIETVKEANRSLIETIEESLQIADEGKRARAAASLELEQMEADLRKTLAAASAPPPRGA